VHGPCQTVTEKKGIIIIETERERERERERQTDRQREPYFKILQDVTYTLNLGDCYILQQS
jgi:hypothetical protein